jgi:hypothetical protein
VLIHPSIHLDIAREQQQDLIVWAERHRLAQVAPRRNAVAADSSRAHA